MVPKRLFTYVILTLIVGIFTGCAQRGATTYDSMNPVGPRELLNKTWQLESLGGEQVDTVDLRQPVTIYFDEARETASGFSGVNQFSGPFAVVDDAISLGPFAMTRMAGPEKAMQIEENYMKALQGATHFRLTGNQMQLYRGSDRVATFVIGGEKAD